jgi:Phage integrase, N-terminal SAM-like domain
MRPSSNVPTLIERYFSERLMRQRNVSANTIASYRDTFRLLSTFAQARLRKPPSALELDDLDAPFIGAFLEDLEKTRGVDVRTRNLRLTAIRSFFRFASFEEPAYSAHIDACWAVCKDIRPVEVQPYMKNRKDVSHSERPKVMCDKVFGTHSEAQRDAEHAGRGMWAGSYVEPWLFRACVRQGGKPGDCSDDAGARP